MQLPRIKDEAIAQNERVKHALEHLARGDFHGVLNDRNALEVMQPLLAWLKQASDEESQSTALSHARESLHAFLESQSKEEDRTVLFLFAIAALHAFIQENWTGPPLERDSYDLRDLMQEKMPVGKPAQPGSDDGDDVLQVIVPGQSVPDDLPVGVREGERSTATHRRVLACLSVDGEEMYAWVRVPVLLLLSHLILQDAAERFPQIEAAPLYELRCLRIYQEMMEQTCASLHDRSSRVIAQVEACAASTDEPLDSHVKAQLHLDLALVYHLYRHIAKASAALDEVQKALGLEIALTGAMGKRTRFQAKSLPQLLVGISKQTSEHHNAGPPDPTCPPEQLPKQVSLDDDTLFEKIKFDEEASSIAETLAPLEQALLLALCYNVQNTNPRDGLTNEEMAPYVDAVLQAPKDWAVQTTALLIQTRLEKVKVRTLQRSTEQLAVLADLFTRRVPRPAARLHSVFSVLLPPYWQLQRELAQRYITIGLHRDALVLYERLELWEGVITAHQLLNQDTTAERIVRARLDVEPDNASLWCALGEITHKEEHFRKAWEMSGQRLTKAMRLLGLMLLRQAEKARESRNELETDKYQRAMECFENCLKLNSLQADVWFSLGCAAMRIEDHAASTRAFRRKVEIDDSDFESWNNLANGYVKSGDKRRAYFAFHEATKHAFDNWKVWENYSAIAVNVGSFNEAIRSINRLLDLKPSYNDWQVLAALVQGVANNVPDVDGRESKQYADKVYEIIKRLRTLSVTDHRVWLVVGRFLNAIGNHKEAYDARRSAYQLLKAVKNWEKNEGAAEQIVECLEDMVEGNVEGSAVQEMNSCKLMIRGVAKTLSLSTEKGYGGEKMMELRDRAHKLLDTVLAFIEEHKQDS